MDVSSSESLYLRYNEYCQGISVKNMLLEDIIVSIVHLIVSSILLFFAVRAYLRTKLPSIFYSMLGFAIIVIGHLLFDILYYNNTEMWRLDEIFDDIGFIMFIIALKKS